MASNEADKQRLTSCCACCPCMRHKCVVYTIRGLVLLFALVAFGASFGGVFGQLFKVVGDNEEEVLNAKALYDAKKKLNIYSTDIGSRYVSALIKPVNKSGFTLWKARFEYFAVNDSATPYAEDVVLRTDYFTCDEGKLRIQIAEGMGIVMVVLCFVNLLMSIFLFFLAPVVKFPLALYQLFASAAAAAVLGLVLHFYMNGWCEQATLHSTGWSWAIGVIMLIVSCVASLIGSVLSAISSVDY